jgi:hypothetical protein
VDGQVKPGHDDIADLAKIYPRPFFFPINAFHAFQKTNPRPLN